MAERKCDHCGGEMAKDEKRKGVGIDIFVQLLQLKKWQHLKLCDGCFPQFCVCCGQKFEELTKGIVPIELASYEYWPDLSYKFPDSRGRNTVIGLKARVCAVCYKSLKQKKLQRDLEYDLQILPHEPTIICERCKGANDSFHINPFTGKYSFISRFCQDCRRIYGLEHSGVHSNLDLANKIDGASRGMRENFERTGLSLTK